jgi:hypothetical protein
MKKALIINIILTASFVWFGSFMTGMYRVIQGRPFLDELIKSFSGAVIGFSILAISYIIFNAVLFIIDLRNLKRQ